MSSAVTSLGYLAFEVKDLAAWESFATNVLGLEVVRRREGGGLALRMDGRAHRFFVTPGELDDVSCLGWDVGDARALAETTQRLRAAGVEVTEGDDAACRARGVAALVRFRDPAGTPSELFHGLERAGAPFKSAIVRNGFVADDLGLGHVVVSARDKTESVAFYRHVLGFHLSDHIVCDFHGYRVDLDFFHAAGRSDARHHSVAMGGPQRKRIHHFMIEAREMDEVGLAFDRTMKAGLRIMQTLGRHPNDRMFSFYAQTPSRFQFEFGWGGRTVDDATWKPTTYDRISEWGHHPPEMLAPPPRRDDGPRR
jgi:2,3-dihydroxybiphenyl 1,2-dioxygenase